MQNFNQVFFRKSLSSFSGTLGDQLIFLVVMAVLSRLLTAEDFGVIALLNSVNGFFLIFAQGGLSTALTQKSFFTLEEDRAAVGLSMLMGISIVLFIVVLSPVLAKFFNDDRLISAFVCASIALFLLPISQVSDGLLKRDLKFGRRAITSVSATIISGVAAVVAAFAGLGYYSLVLQIILRPFIRCCIGWAFVGYFPWPRWDGLVAKEIWNFSGFLILFQIINYWSRQLDNLLIGRFIGLEALGYYSRAYALLLIPLTLLSGVISPVLHATLRKNSQDLTYIRERTFDVVHYIALISMPVMCAASIFASPIIHVFWGSGFSDASMPFSVLAIAAMHQPILSVIGAVFFLLERTRLLFYLGSLSAAIYVAGMVMGLRYGIVGISLGYVVASHLVFIVSMNYLLKHLLQCPWSDYLAYLKTPAILTIAVGLVSFCLKFWVIDPLMLPLGIVLIVACVLVPLWLALVMVMEVSIRNKVILELNKYLPNY